MGRRVAVVASAFGLLIALVIATGAMAAGEGTNFTACLDDKGALTNVAEGLEPSEACKKNAHVVTWNSEGPAGLQGPAGIDGQDGLDGRDGTDGEDGEQGPPGSDGADGIQGEKGDTGANGLPGTDGAGCTVAEDPSGTFTMTCPDGSTVGWEGTPTTSTTMPELETLYLVVQPTIVCYDRGYVCPTALPDEAELDAIFGQASIDIQILEPMVLHSSEALGQEDCSEMLSFLYPAPLVTGPVNISIVPQCGEHEVGLGWLGSSGIVIEEEVLALEQSHFAGKYIGFNLGLTRLTNAAAGSNLMAAYDIGGSNTLETDQIATIRASTLLSATPPPRS